MAYGRNYNRRRLGGQRGNYASTLGLRALPFKRKRPGPSTITGGGAVPRLGRRVRPRMARSYTFTKTKTKQRTGKVISHGDNQSFSNNSIGKKWLTQFDSLMLRKVVSPQTVFSNLTGNVSSAQGKQAVLAFAYLTKTELTSMETASAGAATSVPTKYFLKVGKYVLRLRNQANTNCRMSIYDIVTKRNTVSTTLDNPSEVWTKGMTDFGALTKETIGMTPYRSPEFNQYFGVNRVTTISLEPGQQHDHTVYHKYNRVVDSIQFQNNVGTALAGLTRFIVIVFHGTLGHESLAASNVTYMPITVDYAAQSEYTYGWIDKTTRAFTGTDSNPVAVADFDFMGESGDMDTNPIVS